jgi:acyl carrier protein
MERPEFLRQLDELLDLEPGTLKGDETLESLENWNSLAVIGFMAMIDEHYGIVVPPKQISACTTVENLIELAPASDPV